MHQYELLWQYQQVDMELDQYEDALLLQQEFAVLEQLLAVAVAAHLALVLIQLHIDLLVFPQKFVLFQNKALLTSTPKGISLGAKNRYIIF